MMKHTTRKKRTEATTIRVMQPDPRVILATRLDRLADHNLHLGFHLTAERLSRQAAELRGVA